MKRATQPLSESASLNNLVFLLQVGRNRRMLERTIDKSASRSQSTQDQFIVPEEIVGKKTENCVKLGALDAMVRRGID